MWKFLFDIRGSRLSSSNLTYRLVKVVYYRDRRKINIDVIFDRSNNEFVIIVDLHEFINTFSIEILHIINYNNRSIISTHIKEVNNMVQYLC